MQSSLLTTGEAARVLGVTRQGVRDLIRRGALEVAMHVGTRGDRLLDADAVARLAAERAGIEALVERREPARKGS